MKQIILILTLNLMYVFTSLSQCENNVSTDYNNTPTNDALPTNPPQPDYGEHFLNQFDWWLDPLNPNVDFLLKNLKSTS